ncbi:hypothetical protein D3C81_1180900 [compost metagenome]
MLQHFCSFVELKYILLLVVTICSPVILYGLIRVIKRVNPFNRRFDIFIIGCDNHSTAVKSHVVCTGYILPTVWPFQCRHWLERTVHAAHIRLIPSKVQTITIVFCFCYKFVPVLGNELRIDQTCCVQFLKILHTFLITRCQYSVVHLAVIINQR